MIVFPKVGIKGMEMSKSCSECPFKANDYVCGLLDCAFSCNYFKERNYNCPLVEIVTCKDCIKGQREYTDSKKYCMWIGRITEDDFYCGYAERKE